MTKSEQKLINLRKMVEEIDQKISVLEAQKNLYNLKIQKLEQKHIQANEEGE